jgi:hypothetical protein
MRTGLVAILATVIFATVATAETGPASAAPPSRTFEGFDPIPSDAFLQRAQDATDWIVRNSDYDADVPLPAFVTLPRPTLNYIFYNQFVGGYQGQTCIEALYFPHVMFIADDIQADICASTLVHELVHHFQYLTHKEFLCTTEAEREAYELQAKWVAETGVGEMPSSLFMLRLRCDNPHDYSR